MYGIVFSKHFFLIIFIIIIIEQTSKYLQNTFLNRSVELFLKYFLYNLLLLFMMKSNNLRFHFNLYNIIIFVSISRSGRFFS